MSAAGTSDSETPAAAAPTVGILFVHGIGGQRRGETLTRFGDPLVHWLRASFSRTVIARASVGSETRPSNAQITLIDGAKNRVATWIAAEGFWADAVITPGSAEMLRWSLQVLPWTALTHFDRLVRRSWSSASALEVLDSIVLGAPSAVAVILALVFVLLLMPVIAVALVLLLLLGLMPIPAVQSFALAVQRGLAGSVGDSMILLGSPILRAGIVDRVHDAYRWLVRMRCDQIVVVAHSQGAAIAHEVLRTRACPKVSRFVSLGSGLRKLNEIGDVMENGSPALWFASLSAIALVVSIYALLRLIGVEVVPLAALLLGLGMLWGLAMMGGWGFVSKRVIWLLRKLGRGPKKDDLGGCFWEFSVHITTWIVTTIVTAVSILGAAWYLATVFFPDGGPWYLALVSIMTASVMATMFLIFMWRDGSFFEPRQKPKLDRVPDAYELPPHIRWVDVFASADPVPNGPLAEGLSAQDKRFESVEVENRASILFDHTSYMSNFEEVVSKLGRELLDSCNLSGVEAAGDERLRELKLTRQRRIRALKRARLVVALAALGIAWALWPELVAYATPLEPALVATARNVPFLSTWLVAFIADDANAGALMGALTVVVAFLYYTLAASLWLAWDRGASRAFAKTEPGHSIAMWLFRASIWLAGGACVLLALHRLAVDVLGFGSRGA